MAAPEKQTPRWHGASADNQANNDPIITDDKTATLKAKFALAGHRVHEGSNGDFTVTRWGLSRYCRTFAELQSFAKMLGVQ